MILASALSLNTCIVSLSLSNQRLGSSGAAAIMGAITHLTTLTHLDLTSNGLSADDVAMICGTAAAAGMSQLQNLEIDQCSVYKYFPMDDEYPPIYQSAAAVVASDAWAQLQLPMVPREFMDMLSEHRVGDLLQFVMSEERAAFAASYHPLLPLHLMTGIASNLPKYTEIKFSKTRNAGHIFNEQCLDDFLCSKGFDHRVCSVAQHLHR
jgi:hypothetical protein